MSDLSIGLNGLSGFNLSKELMNNDKYVKQFQDLNGFVKIDDILTSNNSDSNVDLTNDKELMDDLKVLTKGDSQGNSGSNNISSKEIADNFSNVLNDYLNDVTTQQKKAHNAVETFASGGNIDLHSVMIASEKASLSMQLTMQLRNKILNAYKEISSMQV